MPLHHRLENTLRATLDNIAMTHNHAVKIPPVDLLHCSVESRSVGRASSVPQEPFLPLPARVRQCPKNLREYTACSTDASLAELLGCWVVEDQIGLNKGPGGLVIEDDFLVWMRVDIFVLELSVELGVDGDGLLGFEDVADGDVFILLFGALLCKPFGADDFGAGIGLVPRTKEDVVLQHLAYVVEHRLHQDKPQSQAR